MEKSKPPMKTCYYELLEVERTATQKDIEKVHNICMNNFRDTKRPPLNGIQIRTKTRTLQRSSRT